MSAVDVLAVLRGLQVPRAAGVGGRASRAVPGAEEKRDAAIAAVAELIEAVGAGEPGTRRHPLVFTPSQAARVRAALARAGGVK